MATETSRTDGALAGLARFCYRRRRLVLLAWIVGVIVVAFVGFGSGAAPDNDFSGGDSQSAKAQQLMEKHFPKEQGDRLTLAIKAKARGSTILPPSRRSRRSSPISPTHLLPDR